MNFAYGICHIHVLPRRIIGERIGVIAIAITVHHVPVVSDSSVDLFGIILNLSPVHDSHGGASDLTWLEETIIVLVDVVEHGLTEVLKTESVVVVTVVVVVWILYSAFGVVRPALATLADEVRLEAEDIDGVVFKLSDYRGKVVMLDFWGDW